MVVVDGDTTTLSVVVSMFESGIVNKLAIDRTPMGLYQARYTMRGQ